MELLLLPLVAMGYVFIPAPVAAAVPAAVFLGLFARCRRAPALAAGALWLVYMVYEYGMKLRILCSGECNIRVDLLLIYPLLLGVSAVAILVAARCYWRGGSGRQRP